MSDLKISSTDGMFEGKLELFVYDKKELEDLFKALKQIPELISVQRIAN